MSEAISKSQAPSSKTLRRVIEISDETVLELVRADIARQVAELRPLITGCTGSSWWAGGSINGSAKTALVLVLEKMTMKPHARKFQVVEDAA